MSVLGIAGSSLFSYLTQNVQSKKQQFQQEFQQLGQDLQSGNMTAAQSDLTAIQKSMPPSDSSVTSQSSSTMASALSQLSTDLQAGDLTTAQADYALLAKDVQQVAGQPTHSHYHHGVGNSGSSAITQLFSELGSALRSGNPSNAQQAYSSLQQDLLPLAQGRGPAVPGSTGSVSISA